MTAAGALHIAKKLPEGKPRVMQPLWKDSNKPLVAIIEQLDQGKTYFFGIDVKAKEEFFFELAEDIRPSTFTRERIQPVKAEGRLRAVMAYLQVIPGAAAKDK